MKLVMNVGQQRSRMVYRWLEINGFNLDFPSINSGVIKDVVDQAEQLPGRGLKFCQ